MISLGIQNSQGHRVRGESPSRSNDDGLHATSTDYTCANPPSTNSSVPVMKVLSSEARNTTAFAMSSGVPSLPSGMLLESIFKYCSPDPLEAVRSLSPGVSIGPGLTAFTRMRRSFKSVVHVRANERTAALVAL